MPTVCISAAPHSASSLFGVTSITRPAAISSSLRRSKIYPAWTLRLTLVVGTAAGLMPSIERRCFDASKETCSDDASSNSTRRADALNVPLAMVSRVPASYKHAYMRLSERFRQIALIHPDTLCCCFLRLVLAREEQPDCFGYSLGYSALPDGFCIGRGQFLLWLVTNVVGHDLSYREGLRPKRSASAAGREAGNVRGGCGGEGRQGGRRRSHSGSRGGSIGGRIPIEGGR